MKKSILLNDPAANATESSAAAAMNKTGIRRHTEQQPAYWSGVFAMSLCVFALIASEFMPVSLLTPIAADLGVTEGMAGQGIAVSGAFAVLTSLFIPTLAGNLNRKTLLLGLTGVMAVSGAVIAMAPNYFIYMIGRALIGVVVGGFWSMSAATAMRLVPTSKVPRALAIFNSGNAFVFKLFRNRTVTLGMLGVGVFFMGQFTLFTYIRPFLETATGAGVSAVTTVLLLIGVAGFVGTTLIGAALKRGFYQTLIAIPVLMATIALSLIAFGGWIAAVIALLGIWGLVSTAAPVGWWAWVPRTFPKNAEAGGGLMVAMIQLSIALGSTVGGLLFDYGGYQSTFFASGIMLMVAALLVFLTSRSETA